MVKKSGWNTWNFPKGVIEVKEGLKESFYRDFQCRSFYSNKTEGG